jgi:mono/diheme cytochrome c family protein
VSATVVTIGILALAAILVVALLTANANRRRRKAELVPPALRPAYSDEQLERTVLERYMAWGLVLTVVLAVFLPGYWLVESNRLAAEQESFYVDAAVRGEEQYQENCSRCHSANLGGGAAASPYGGDPWPAPALNNIVMRYEESRNVTDVRDLIVQTIHRGRPGTPMPTWGAAFGGPMTDQQIDDITNFILVNQVETVTVAMPASDQSGEELYQGNCVKCHGDDLGGLVGPTLIGVLERHSRDDILGILSNGIYLPTGTVMPGFGEAQYQYEGARYDDDALERIVDYLEERQPEELPSDAGQYQTPGIGEDEPPPASDDESPPASDDESPPASDDASETADA